MAATCGCWEPRNSQWVIDREHSYEALRRIAEAQALESLCKALESRELHLALPGAEPADGLRTEPMMMLRPTGAAALPETLYTPLAMD